LTKFFYVKNIDSVRSNGNNFKLVARKFWTLFLSAFDIAAEVAKVDICKALPIFVEIEDAQEVALLGLSRKTG